jgi:hypothetical protein
MTQVIIGVDPPKLSATIEVVDPQEKFLGSGRFTTDQAGYSAMLKYVKSCLNGSGPLRESTAPADLWLSGSLKPASRWSMCRPSSPPGSGSSTPATTARPMPATPTRSGRRRPHRGLADPQGRRGARGAADADRPS